MRATDQAPESMTQVDVVRIPFDPEPPVLRAHGRAVPPRGRRQPRERAAARDARRDALRLRLSWGWGLLPTGPGRRRPTTRIRRVCRATYRARRRGAAHHRARQRRQHPHHRLGLLPAERRQPGEARPTRRPTRSARSSCAAWSPSSTRSPRRPARRPAGRSERWARRWRSAVRSRAMRRPRATGAGLALANPGYQNTVARRTGSVAMDLKIVDPSNGRLVSSVMANGSFSSEVGRERLLAVRLRHREQRLRGERAGARRTAPR